MMLFDGCMCADYLFCIFLQECGFTPSVISYGCLINLYTKVNFSPHLYVLKVPFILYMDLFGSLSNTGAIMTFKL